MTTKLLNFFFLATIFLSGCASHEKPTISVQEKQIPKWYLNPPASTSSTLYSIGEGSSKKDAIANALSDMVATLSISIQSEFKSSSHTHNYNGIESYSKDTQSSLQATVKKIRVSNYKVINYEKMGFRKYLVLISSSKMEIFNSLKDEVDKKIDFYKNQENTYASTNVLKQLTFYKNASAGVQNLVYKSLILKILNPSFNDKYILKSIAHFQNKYTQLKSQISFEVSSNSGGRFLVSVVKDALNSEGLKFSSTRNRYHLYLSINSNIIYTRTYGFILARSVVVIKVKDYKHQTISTKQLNIQGQSTQGRAVAKESVARNLKSLIKEKGIKVIIDL